MTDVVLAPECYPQMVVISINTGEVILSHEKIRLRRVEEGEQAGGG